MIKGSILREYITTLNVYVLGNRVSKYMRQKLIEIQGKRQIQYIAGDINIPLSVTGSSNRQKISKDTVELNSTTNQLDLTNIYKIFHPT